MGNEWVEQAEMKVGSPVSWAMRLHAKRPPVSLRPQPCLASLGSGEDGVSLEHLKLIGRSAVCPLSIFLPL